jgi:hypothetical protein
MTQPCEVAPEPPAPPPPLPDAGASHPFEMVAPMPRADAGMPADAAPAEATHMHERVPEPTQNKEMAPMPPERERKK